MNKGLKNENSKVVVLTKDIKRELLLDDDDKVKVLGSGYDDDFFYSLLEKKII